MAMLLAAGLFTFGQTELPDSDDDSDSFEVEPPPLVPNLPAEREKAATGSSKASLQPAELEQRVERAKRNAADAELLFKRGVLSRMEVELRALRVIRLQADLENARLKAVQAEFALQQTQFEMGQLTKEQFDAGVRAVEAATEKADAAAATRDRAEIAAAEKNLQRQRKLMALGTARASDVARAEKKLAELKASKN